MSEAVVTADIGVTRSTVRRGTRAPFSVIVSGVIVSVAVICAIIGGWIAPQNPNAQNLLTAARGPSASHLLGTDELGRDVLSRVIAGARPALDGPIVIVIAAMLLGGFLGLAAGSLGGIVDALVSRWVDLMYSLPWLLVAIVLVGVLGAGYWQAVAVLVVLTAPYNARLIRAAALEQRSRPYVEAARVLGLSRRRILVIHIGSNIVPFVISICMLNFAFALLALSGLSFLGLGVPPGTPDWGEMVAESQKLIFQNPLAGLAPGLAIMATATSMTVVGDWLFQSLSGRSGR